MLYALLIYEKPADFAKRDASVATDSYIGAWRRYYQAMVDAGIYVGGSPLDGPETATTVRLRDDKRTAHMPAPRSNSAASPCLSCRRWMRRWNGRRAARRLAMGR